MQQKGSVLPVLILIFVLVGSGIYLINNLKNTQPKTGPTPIATTQVPSPSPSTSSLLKDFDPNKSILFESKKLGIRFYYAKTAFYSQAEQVQIKILEQGNKIYVYLANSKPENGQYIEVFEKDKNASLADAIKERFLKSYSEKDCFVSTKLTNTSVAYPTNFELAEITFPQTSNPDEAWWVNAKNCPQAYVTAGGTSYFLMDKNHPAKLAYLKIGQYSIEAETGNMQKGWEDTVEFTD